MKVFYSWQSDTPSNVCRSFIRAALDEAVAELELTEAERPEIDQDTQGVLGSPVVATVIFDKIRAASVVVADVTLTGSTLSGKKRAINSNVAVELGYAIGIHSDECLLKVMNVHYGPPSDLPFDLQIRRYPLQFQLAPDASAEIRQKVKKRLIQELRDILKAYMQAHRARVTVEQPVQPIASTSNFAAYWSPGEDLIAAEEARLPSGKGLSYQATQPLAYLRLWPLQAISPLAISVLNDYAKSSLEPLFREHLNGWSHARNRFGRVTYAHRNGHLLATVQLFKTGEIWAVSEDVLRRIDDYPLLIPMIAFEQGVLRAIKAYLHAAQTRFGYGETVGAEVGLVNVRGYKLAVKDRQLWGPIFEDGWRCIVSIDTTSATSLHDALLTIFKSLFEASGHERPERYNAFPPNI